MYVCTYVRMYICTYIRTYDYICMYTVYCALYLTHLRIHAVHGFGGRGLGVFGMPLEPDDLLDKKDPFEVSSLVHATADPCSVDRLVRLALQQIRRLGNSESAILLVKHRRLASTRTLENKVAIIQKNERGRMNIVKAALTWVFFSLMNSIGTFWFLRLSVLSVRNFVFFPQKECPWRSRVCFSLPSIYDFTIVALYGSFGHAFCLLVFARALKN